MWLVLSQPGGSDINSWSLNGHVWIALTATGEQCRNAARASMPCPGRQAVAAVVFNSSLSTSPTHSGRLVNAFAEWELEDTDKVWVHFGGTNSQTFSWSKIKDDWTLLCSPERNPALQSLRGLDVRPYSMTSKTKWDRILQSLAAGVKSNCNDDIQSALSRLEMAWRDATFYYQVLQPLGRLVEAVFPFLLELHSIYNSRGLDSSLQEGWLQEAIESLRGRCNSLADKSLLEGTTEIGSFLQSALEDRQSLESALKGLRSILESGPSTMSNPKDFLQLEELSRSYRALEQQLISGE